jgi:ribose transport system permease protein
VKSLEKVTVADEVPRPRQVSRVRRFAGWRDTLARYGVGVVLTLLVVVFSVAMPATFATTGNFKAIIVSQAVLLLLALTATLPLRNGEFDVSIAATMALSGAVTARLVLGGVPVGIAAVIALAIGAFIGLINGFLVVIIGTDAFVTTLAMLTALGGIAYAVTNGNTLTGFPSSLLTMANFEILGLPVSVYYGWFLTVLLWYVYERTPVGRYLLFVGGNRDAARLAGLRVDLIRMLAFVSGGMLSAFAGLILIGSLGAINPNVGPQYLLPPFVAAFLGATTIYVGRFNALGTLLALYLVAVGITGLQLLGADFWIADVFNGVALVAALLVARLARGRITRIT